MQFTRPRRRRAAENIVPMINVVFLLLVFFLMTARIAPPDPLDVTPPVSDGGAAAEAASVLYITADGGMAFGTFRGDAVFAALDARDRAAPLLIRADEKLPAQRIAKLLPRLAGMGFAKVALITGSAR